MCGLFKTPKIVQQAQPAVTAADAEVQKAAEETRKRLLNRKGYASTVLTGGDGVATATTPTATRQLLGMGG